MLGLYEDGIRQGLGTREIIDCRLNAAAKLHQTLALANQFAEAEAVARQLAVLHEPLARTVLGHRVNLAWDHVMIACDLASQKRDADADAEFDEGMSRLARLRLDLPLDPMIRLAEIQAGFNAAQCARNSGRLPRAEQFYRMVATLAAAADEKFPGLGELGEMHLRCLEGVVEAIELARPEEALVVHRRKVELNARLIDRNPQHDHYSREYVHGAVHSYQLCKGLGRPAEAEAEIERAVAIGERLVAASPALFDPTGSLLDILPCQAEQLEATGRPRQAIAQLDRMIALCEPWNKQSPLPMPPSPTNPAPAHRCAATLLAKLGEHREAARRLSLVLEISQLNDRGQVQLDLARELLACQDHPRARAAAEQAALDPAVAAEAARFLATLDQRPAD